MGPKVALTRMYAIPGSASAAANSGSLKTTRTAGPAVSEVHRVQQVISSTESSRKAVAVPDLLLAERMGAQDVESAKRPVSEMRNERRRPWKGKPAARELMQKASAAAGEPVRAVATQVLVATISALSCRL
jgi:hypothetical protein